MGLVCSQLIHRRVAHNKKYSLRIHPGHNGTKLEFNIICYFYRFDSTDMLNHGVAHGNPVTLKIIKLSKVKLYSQLRAVNTLKIVKSET